MLKNDRDTGEVLKTYENTTVFCFCNDSKLRNQTNFKKWVIDEIDEYLLNETHLLAVGTILIELLIDIESFHEYCVNLKNYVCDHCLRRLICIQRFQESEIEDVIYSIGMIFTKILFQPPYLKLVEMNQVVSLIIELVKNCIRHKIIQIKSINEKDNSKKYSDNTDELITQVLSLGLIQISLMNYDDAYATLKCITIEFPEIDRLVNCLKKTILIIFMANSLEDLGTKPHKYFTECYLHYPNIIHCFIRTKLSLVGIDLNQPPLASINTGACKNPEVYSSCRDLLEVCFGLSGNNVNYEINYTLSRLYYEVDGNLDKSINIMNELLEKAPFNETYRVYLGKLLYSKAINARKNNSDLSFIKSILKKVMIYIPQSSEVYCDLGTIYYELGKNEKAIWCFRLSVHFNPMNINAHFNFGGILRKLGFIDQAISCFERVFKINPSCVYTLNIIAALYNNICKIDLSFEHFSKCLDISKNSPEVYNNLGVLYRDCGNFFMAKNCFLEALNLNPSHIMAFQNLIYILNYFVPLHNKELENKVKNSSIELILDNLNSPTKNPCLNVNKKPDLYVCKPQHWVYNSDYYVYYQDMYELSLEWGDKFIEMHKEIKCRLDKLIPISEVPDIISSSGTELINIGFVGAEFFHHAVAFFILAPIKFLIENFSKNSSRNDISVSDSKVNLNIFIYDNSPNHDYYSCFFKELVPCENWRYIHGKDLEYTSNLIRTDKIHILFDLSGHTVNNCLALFAIRNSPIQISWVGYPNTTGLRYMDYRITDKIADPVNTKQRYSEKLLYLPNCFLCYTIPKIKHPPISEPPYKKNGYITFGSFNRVTKLHPLTIDLWGEVLKAVPNSHLLLKSKAFSSISCRKFYLEIFKSNYGIEPHRISLFPLNSSYYSHLELYNEIDISLDTFPYSGTTTTFECIFMGVPIITLSVDQSDTPEEGSSDIYKNISSFHSQNVGRSILTNLNLEELIVSNKSDFIRVASNLANDTERINYYRSNLRRILSESKLCDGDKFSREFFEIILHALKSHRKNVAACE